ncbi:MAG TPA: polymer-forming cytoskeletal protein [Ramlibacter sp.]|uniref:polymer-forming cytoskeletal protein n=1 Tax=Ramlibacter sp. TaxID=1917967 RepID=UPI002C8A4E84|nr:polymer-forming cytoskeletal protein [Ramlibacter sp.]HVZ46692.1 polymer-forming cytoskeletal protein [Ramlibacter sp.]
MRAAALVVLGALVAGAGAAHAGGDTFLAGGDVRSARPIEGDFMAFGGHVLIDEPVRGDAAIAGGAVEVRSAVGDDLAAAGGNVSIDAAVAGDLMAAGGNVTLSKQAVIGKNARIYAGDVVVDGRIEGDLKGSARKFTINGEVGGDVRVQAEDVELGPEAKIGGTLAYTSRNELKKAEGAAIGGGIARDAGSPRRTLREREPESPLAWLVRSVVVYLGLLACAALFMVLFPAFALRAAQRVRASPWLALAVGVAVLLAVPVAAVLMMITILGIPLALVTLAAYPVLLLAGFVLGVVFLARLLARAVRHEDVEGYSQVMGYVAVALVGVVLLHLVPFAGGLLIALMSLAGLGALLLELFSRWGLARKAV